MINLVQNADGSASFQTENAEVVARMGGPKEASLSASQAQYPNTITVKIPLAAGTDTGGGVLSWQNPEGVAILIRSLVIDLTTAATGACTLDFGTTASSATTSNDGLIDGLDANAATGLFDNITDKGTNGKSRQKLAAGKWLTGSRASGASAGLAGYAYLTYVPVR